jgi:hypothetical protein
MNGYRLSLQWNDSYAFRDYPPLTDYQRIHQELVPDMSGHSRPGVRRCEKCGDIVNKWDEPLTGLVIKERLYDISITYDGIVLVSDAFRKAYDEASLGGLVFRALPTDPGFHSIQTARVVSFDYERRKTRFLKKCNVCERWESVVGATPVLLESGSVIGDREFVRTDLEFGNFDAKHPLLLCGLEAGKALRGFGLRGVDLCELITEQQKRAMKKQEGKT